MPDNAPLENPFASTHSLDENPFDDPGAHSASAAAAAPTYDPSLAARQAELDRRAQELEARERELTQRQEHIRKHGRNNWPPCEFILLLLLQLITNVPM